MRKTYRAIRIAVAIGSGAAFCLWAAKQEKVLSLGTPFAFLSLALFSGALISALFRLATLAGTDGDPLSSDTRAQRLKAWAALIGFGMAVSLVQYMLVFLLARPGTGFLAAFDHLYYRSDVAHYMGIARDWYAKEGDARLRLVFLPLYPLSARLFTWGENYYRGAFLAAQVFSLLCLPAGYELFRQDVDRRAAMACARLLFLLPGCAFLRVPMSESLFLLLTLLAVCFGRKKLYLPAALFAALSALTRSLGILILVLLGVEMLYDFALTWRQDHRRALSKLPGFAACLLLGCGGTLAYLAINRSVSGSAFTFLTYQRENWNQRMGLFFNTAAYQAQYAQYYLEQGKISSFLSLSVPNILCCFGTLGLLYAHRDRMRVSYLIWALVYFAAAVGATWLLSGPRYLGMLFVIAFPLKRLGNTAAKEGILEGILFLLQTGYLLMLALDMSVY